MGEPEHGQISTCAVCGTQIEYVVATVNIGADVVPIDEWWAHETHPDDGHDAAPSDSFTCPVCQRTSWHPKDVEHGWCGACRNITRRNDPAMRVFRQIEALNIPTSMWPRDVNATPRPGWWARLRQRLSKRR